MSRRESYIPGTFCWVDLMAHDKDAAIRFYEGLFGWEAQVQTGVHDNPYVIFTYEGDAVAGLGECTEEMKQQGFPTVWNSYVSVLDADAAAKRAEDLGAEAMFPVMDAEEAGRLAFFTDPEGASFAIWQAKEHVGAQRVNEPNTFCWNEKSTRDREGSKGFYGGLFGWRFQPMEMPNGNYDLVMVGERGNGGVLEMTEEWGDMPPSWMVYFNVADLEQARAKVEELGGTLNTPVVDTEVGPFSVATDSQGAVLSIIQLKDWE